jgi:hypothetical protein
MEIPRTYRLFHSYGIKTYWYALIDLADEKQPYRLANNRSAGAANPPGSLKHWHSAQVSWWRQRRCSVPGAGSRPLQSGRKWT